MAEKEVKTSFNHSHNLEEYVLLAKSARGAGVVALIQKALEAPGVYVFGELMEMPSVKEVLKIHCSLLWPICKFMQGIHHMFCEQKVLGNNQFLFSVRKVRKFRILESFEHICIGDVCRI